MKTPTKNILSCDRSTKQNLHDEFELFRLVRIFKELKFINNRFCNVFTNHFLRLYICDAAVITVENRLGPINDQNLFY